MRLKKKFFKDPLTGKLIKLIVEKVEIIIVRVEK